MSKTKIEKYIEQVEKDFVLNYEAETEKLLADKEALFNAEVKELKEKVVQKAKSEQKETLATTKQALEFEEKSKGEALKSLMIEEIYDDVFAKLQGLEGQHLLDLVAGLIAKENLTGEHRILVKKVNLSKFKKALSNKTDCDLLNAKVNNATFKLAVYDDAVDEGFIVEDQVFDLYFDFKTLVEKHKEEHAFAIYQKLFGDK
ncbi:MAG: hypothetical protein AB7E23_00460 [Bacilli bacterium]